MYYPMGDTIRDITGRSVSSTNLGLFCHGQKAATAQSHGGELRSTQTSSKTNVLRDLLALDA